MTRCILTITACLSLVSCARPKVDMVPLRNAVSSAYSLRSEEIFQELVDEYEKEGRVPPKETPYDMPEKRESYRKGFSDGWRSDPSYRGYLSASLAWRKRYDQMRTLVDDPEKGPYATGYVGGADAYARCGKRAQDKAKQFRAQMKEHLERHVK